MQKNLFIFSVIILGFTIIHGNEVNIDKSTENSITKDYDQDGVYSSYEKALRKTQESVYVKLPERRGYWYTMLDRIKAEEEELMPDEVSRMRKR